jgi:hypothetical protein
VVVVALSLHEEKARRVVLGPIITMIIGLLIFGGGAAWYFWPAPGKPALEKSKEPPKTEFSGWTNSQLRERVAIVVDGMRNLEAQYSKAIAAPNFPSPNASQEERHRVWEESTKRLTQLSAERDFIFQSKYLSEARTLRTEMLRRVPDIVVGKNPMDQNSMGIRVLDSGMLAGVHPLYAAADYLESLARTLP